MQVLEVLSVDAFVCSVCVCVRVIMTFQYVLFYIIVDDQGVLYVHDDLFW